MHEELWPKLVGARVKRVEDLRLLIGKGSFTDDYHPAGMLHVALLRSAHAYARVLRIDTAPAQSLPGVIEVFTGDDLADAARPVVAVSKMRDYRTTPMWMLASWSIDGPKAPVGTLPIMASGGAYPATYADRRKGTGSTRRP